MNISFLLGAGFSVPAKIPTVDNISEKFKQTELKDKILYFSSMEWAWAEFANDAEKNNGRLNWKYLFETSYILEESVKIFLAEKNTEILNYEEFLSWLLNFVSDKNSKWVTLHNSLVNELNKLAPNDSVTNTINIKSRLISCFIHLLSSLLYVRTPIDQLKQHYNVYLNLFANKNNSINVFTLNHDLLLEMLLENSVIEYRDGFNIESSSLVDDDNKKIKIFDNSYSNGISLAKLHGSIDQYRYYYIEAANRHLGYDYYKTYSYQTKHWARHIDEQGTTIQKFSPEITPHFLTGTNKDDLISNDKMYSALYKRFENSIEKIDKLIIVGYSYSDEHINLVLEVFCDDIKEIININPKKKFPYEHNNVTNINPLKEIVKF